jgi:hypothetical protein
MQRKVAGRPRKALEDLKPKSLRQRARRLEKTALAKVTGGQELQQFQEDLLALLETKTGERLLSEVCANLKVSQNHQQVVQNFKEIYHEMKPELEGGKRKNSANAGAVVSAFGAGTTYGFLEDVLKIPRGLARTWRSLAKKKGKLPEFFTASYPSGVHRPGMLLQIKAALVQFFKSQTYILSGAKRETRNLGISKSELERRLFAFFPELLRRVARENPLLLEHSKNPTRVQVSMAKAVEAARTEGFDQQDEFELRKAYADALYLARVVKRRTFKWNEPAVEEGEESSFNRHEEDDDGHVLVIDDPDQPLDEVEVSAPSGVQSYHVPAMSTFWAVLKASKVRYTTAIHAHECPLHDNGPLWELQFAQVVDARIFNVEDKGLEQRQRELAAKVKRYRDHIEQYVVQRPFVKELERNLQPGECILYRDFVNQYNANQGKVANLQLVILTRDVIGGPLKVQKISNFCSDKDTAACDAFFVADVMAFHLQPKGKHSTGLLSGFSKIYQCGDHGPHFVSRHTVLNESRFHELYGVEFENHFLCSYHAYNRCDGAGVESKRLAEQAIKARGGPVRGYEYAALINESAYIDHVAFPFERINRSAKLFPAVKDLAKVTHLKRMCEVLYRHDPPLPVVSSSSLSSSATSAPPPRSSSCSCSATSSPSSSSSSSESSSASSSSSSSTSSSSSESSSSESSSSESSSSESSSSSSLSTSSSSHCGSCGCDHGSPTQDDCFTIGVFRCRRVSGGKDPLVMHELQAGRGPELLCQVCSTRHAESACPNKHVPSFASRDDLPIPDPARFGSTQVDRKGKVKSAEEYPYECPVKCGKLYKTPGICNKHLNTKHSAALADPKQPDVILYPIPTRAKRKSAASTRAKRKSTASTPAKPPPTTAVSSAPPSSALASAASSASRSLPSPASPSSASSSASRSSPSSPSTLPARRSSRNKKPRYEAAGAPNGEAYVEDEDCDEDEDEAYEDEAYEETEEEKEGLEEMNDSEQQSDSEEQLEQPDDQRVIQFKDGSTLVQGEILLVEYGSRHCLCEVLDVNAEESVSVQFWGRITVSGRYYPSWTDKQGEENFMTDERRDQLHGKSQTLDPTANYHPISATQITHREITLTSGVPPANIAVLIGTPIIAAPARK